MPIMFVSHAQILKNKPKKVSANEGTVFKNSFPVIWLITSFNNCTHRRKWFYRKNVPRIQLMLLVFICHAQFFKYKAYTNKASIT